MEANGSDEHDFIVTTAFGSGVDSGGAGGARTPLEFEGSEKVQSLISNFLEISYYSKPLWIWKAIYGAAWLSTTIDHVTEDVVLMVMFIYSVKATKICEISTLFLTTILTMEISQNFVAFSEYMNFTISTTSSLTYFKTSFPCI